MVTRKINAIVFYAMLFCFGSSYASYSKPVLQYDSIERMHAIITLEKAKAFINKMKQEGVSIDYLGGVRGKEETLLGLAARVGYDHAVELLLEEGADYNLCNPLSGLSHKTLSVGTDPKFYEFWKKPNFQYRRQQSHFKIVDMLLDHGRYLSEKEISDLEGSSNSSIQEYIKNKKSFIYKKDRHILYSEWVLEEECGLPKDIARLTTGIIYGDWNKNSEWRNRIDKASYYDEVGRLE